PRHVDEQVVGSELIRGGERVERRAHAERGQDMRRNLEAELAPDLPGRLEVRQVDLTTHDHGDELVIGREPLLLDAARIVRILVAGNATRALEIAEGGTAARI